MMVATGTRDALIAEIMALRQEEAQLLGYANAAEVSLATKMAKDPAHVIGFLRDLAQRARPHAERDVADMRSYLLLPRSYHRAGATSKLFPLCCLATASKASVAPVSATAAVRAASKPSADEAF